MNKQPEKTKQTNRVNVCNEMGAKKKYTLVKQILNLVKWTISDGNRIKTLM